LGTPDQAADYLLGPREFFQRFAGRYFGKYRGLVKDNQDPRQLGRVRVLVPDVFGDFDLSPWAFPSSSGWSGVDTGCFSVPPVDALVWLTFEQGDATSPVYDGGFWTEVDVGRPDDGSWLERFQAWQSNRNPVPMHAQGIPDGSDLDGGIKGVEGLPASQFRGTYPNVRVLRTPGKHMLEFDDTSGEERVQLMHRIGSHLEFLKTGDTHLAAVGKLLTYSRARTEHVAGNLRSTVRGAASYRVDGDLTFSVGGKFTVEHGGARADVLPSRDETVQGRDKKTVFGAKSSKVHGSLTYTSGADVSLGAMNDMGLSAVGRMTLFGLNAQGVPGTDALSLTGVNGYARVEAQDRTKAGRFGVEAIGQNLLSGLPQLTAVSAGPLVRLGNLSIPASPTAVPLVQEPGVLGLQLQLLLTQFFQALATYTATLSTGGTTPGFGGPNPVLASANVTLQAQLATLVAQFLTPAGVKLQPQILSDVVFLSKE